ncbi:MAG: bestrophin family ion channel [Cruoricaptor ignavus]|nr:bestrophin family ion channel [Cruoricaptor ignavus]
MFVGRKLRLKNIQAWLGRQIFWLVIFNSGIAMLYYFGLIKLSLPWLPVSIIGTAVAFFVGFKNNQAYDRMWEARKIWGGIVNDSRSFSMFVNTYVKSSAELPLAEAKIIKQKLIYRHIAWLYAHRIQLLEPTQWEQVSASGHTGKWAERFSRNFGLGRIDGDVHIEDLKKYLSEEEYNRLPSYKNMSTQLTNNQSEAIAELYEKGIINDFQQMQFMEILRTLYELQGRNERIKKFPFPRDYSSMSLFFVTIFIVLFPFSLIPELLLISKLAFWVSIPITTLIGMVYIIMEQLGDYHENPYMGTPHAMPMLSICRTIEIDLRQMLGETELPPAIKTVDTVLM